MKNEIKTQTLPLQGMRAMVTGGAQGIGAGICLELALTGATVAVLDCQEDKTEKLVKKIIKCGGSAIAIYADIASTKVCQQAVKKTYAKKFLVSLIASIK